MGPSSYKYVLKIVSGAIQLLAISYSVGIGGEAAAADNPVHVIRNMFEQEARIKTVQASFEVSVPERSLLLLQGTWKYDGVRELYDATLFLVDPDTPSDLANRIPNHMTFGYDGDVMRIRHRSKGITGGRVTSLEAITFNDMYGLRTLLGAGIKTNGRQLVGQALWQAIQDDPQSVRLRPPEVIHGRSAIVMEASGIDMIASDHRYDALVWVDPERDYRVLRIEKYRDLGEANKWQALVRRIENTDLQRIDGVWLPVIGRVEPFQYKVEKSQPDGEQPRIVSHPWRDSRVISIDPMAVHLNAHYPKDDFVVKFEFGTRVFDDYLGTGYIVGKGLTEHAHEADLNPSVLEDPVKPSGKSEKEAALRPASMDEPPALKPTTGDARPRIGSLLIICIAAAGIIAVTVWRILMNLKAPSSVQ